MARITDAKCRLCRRESEALFLKGARCYTEKCAVRRRETPPGAGLRRRRRRLSEYGVRLREKQKLKRIYGVLERQFRRVFEEARRQKGNTGENVLLLLERRLDNTVYALGMAPSRAMARQMITHGHVRLNDRRATIPSMLVRAGDKVTPWNSDKAKKVVKESIELVGGIRQAPAWVSLEEKSLTGTVVALPKRADVPYEINELLVVEVCSR